jgi:hypothetical protein
MQNVIDDWAAAHRIFFFNFRFDAEPLVSAI